MAWASCLIPMLNLNPQLSLNLSEPQGMVLCQLTSLQLHEERCEGSLCIYTLWEVPAKSMLQWAPSQWTITFICILNVLLEWKIEQMQYKAEKGNDGDREKEWVDWNGRWGGRQVRWSVWETREEKKGKEDGQMDMQRRKGWSRSGSCKKTWFYIPLINLWNQFESILVPI